MSTDYKSINLSRYDANAQRLSSSYNSIDTPTCLPVLAALVEQYKGGGRDALDIGCGSGRDAFWLCGNGWNVTAADGSAGMIEEAQKTHAHEKVEFLHDLAPDFPRVREKKTQHDLITMAAFIFHFDEAERRRILENVSGLLKDEGIIHITLRHGPPSLDRTIFDVQAEEIAAFAQSKSMEFRAHGIRADTTGRSEITWTHCSLWRGANWNLAKDITV